MNAPRALVVVIDRLHLGFLGCYGNEWIETPAFDRWACEGSVFDFCFPLEPAPGDWRKQVFHSHPRARSGRRSLKQRLTERETQVGFFTDHPGVDGSSWRDEDPSLVFLAPKAFVESADEAAAGWNDHPEYRAPPSPTADARRWMARWRWQQLAGSKSRRLAAGLDDLVEHARRWLTEEPSRSRLAWVEIGFHAHPWLPPREFEERYLDEETPIGIRDPLPGLLGEAIHESDLPGVRAHYAARVAYLDDAIDRLTESFHDQANHLLVVTADAGMPLGEHGCIGGARPALYEELVHVPLLVAGVGVRPSSRRNELTTTLDLAASLEAFFGLEPDEPEQPEGPEQGHVLARARGQGGGDRPFLQLQLEGEQALITSDWKLIIPPAGDRPLELYQKPRDRWDRHNLADAEPAVTERLLTLRKTASPSEGSSSEFKGTGAGGGTS